MDREKLRTAGNTNGRDVDCEACGEPWENYGIVYDFTDEELKHVILGNYADDPGGSNLTCIVGLSKCPCCND